MKIIRDFIENTNNIIIVINELKDSIRSIKRLNNN